MKHLVLALLAGTIALTPLMGVAQGKQAIIQQYADFPTGVIEPVKTDANGNIRSLVIIGKAPLPRSMPRARAIDYAGKKAKRNAMVAFAEFLNTNISMQRSDNEEVVFKLKGSAAGDQEGASNEENNSTEVTSEQSKNYAKAALSGLRILAAGFDSNGGYVIVFGWKLSDCAGIANAAKAMEKAARTSVNAAKALEGAHRQDPDAAYQKAEGSASAMHSNTETNAANADTNSGYSAGYGPNAAPTRTSAVATGAEDFF